IAVDLKSGRVLSSTLPHKEWAGFVRALSHDWNKHQHSMPYGLSGYLIAAGAIITGVVIIAGSIAVAPVVIGGVTAGYIVTVGTMALVEGGAALVIGVAEAVKTYNTDQENAARDAKAAENQAANEKNA